MLYKNEALFINFFNLPLVGAAITSCEKGWIEVNDRTCEILGYSREQLFKKDWAELTHPDDLAADRALFEKMLSGEISGYSIEKRFIRSDGGIVWTILSGGRSCTDDPQSEYFYEQILDITERKNAEAELVGARNEAERARQSLQRANEELKKYAQYEIEQSRIREREQLLQDMHDGFGSNLASIRILAELGKIQSTELPQYLEELSNDLHLVVDTLRYSSEITIENALVDMRYRLEKRLNVSGPFIQWKIDLEQAPLMQARTILHILRIIQEAINNALKHAQPRSIILISSYNDAEKRLTVSVRDDGIGISAHPRAGRGLHNMQRRAREIGAKIEWISCDPGTEVAVVMTL